MRRCLLSSLRNLNDLLHTSQENGRAEVGMHWCSFRSFSPLNNILHTSQENGHILLCMSLCTFRIFLLLNDLLHTLQEYGHAPHCVLCWFFTVVWWPNDSLPCISCPFTLLWSRKGNIISIILKKRKTLNNGLSIKSIIIKFLEFHACAYPYTHLQSSHFRIGRKPFICSGETSLHNRLKICLHMSGFLHHTYCNFLSIPFNYITEKLYSGELMQIVVVHSQILCPFLLLLLYFTCATSSHESVMLLPVLKCPRKVTCWSNDYLHTIIYVKSSYVRKARWSFWSNVKML